MHAVVDDEGTLHIRAVISVREELDTLIEKLQKQREKLPVAEKRAAETD